LGLAERTGDHVERAKFAWMLAQLAERSKERAEALARYERAQLLFEETGPEELIERAATKVKELQLRLQ
jgi:hypothetical protein